MTAAPIRLADGDRCLYVTDVFCNRLSCVPSEGWSASSLQPIRDRFDALRGCPEGGANATSWGVAVLDVDANGLDDVIVYHGAVPTFASGTTEFDPAEAIERLLRGPVDDWTDALFLQRRADNGPVFDRVLLPTNIVGASRGAVRADLAGDGGLIELTSRWYGGLSLIALTPDVPGCTLIPPTPDGGAARGWGYAVSLDGGASWSPATAPGQYH